MIEERGRFESASTGLLKETSVDLHRFLVGVGGGPPLICSVVHVFLFVKSGKEG